jgi:hypothetical protein
MAVFVVVSMSHSSDKVKIVFQIYKVYSTGKKKKFNAINISKVSFLINKILGTYKK